MNITFFVVVASHNHNVGFPAKILMLKVNKSLLFVLLFLILGVVEGFPQTSVPTPVREERETVVTEEIKVSVAAFNEWGEFVSDVRKEDLVVSEDGRLQQASSIRHTPANVLIVLDTGGEMRSNLSQTRAAAKNLVESLRGDDRVSIFQFADSVEMLADWTTDRSQILAVLDRKLSFGRRNALNEALNKAVEFFYKMPIENRHLVLITGGIDSFNDSAQRDAATAALMASDINVHVVSYTNLQRNSIAAQKAIFIEGEPKPQRLPEEVADTLPDWKGSGKKKMVSPRDMAKMPRLGSITLDRERIKRAKENVKELENGEQFLKRIAEDANGEILLPETFDEMIEKTATLAKTIDSQYVITYVPKRPLNDSPKGEIRRIEVTSRREGLEVESRRKFVVKGKNN